MSTIRRETLCSHYLALSLFSNLCRLDWVSIQGALKRGTLVQEVLEIYFMIFEVCFTMGVLVCFLLLSFASIDQPIRVEKKLLEI